MKNIITPLFTFALSFAFFVGCVPCSSDKKSEVSEQYAPIADYACTCTNATWLSVVTNEVSIEDIGERYEVQTHHYFPDWIIMDGGTSTTIRIKVAVRYPKQYLREGEPTDTSITNKECFCGGPWEFETNGYFRCERITKRTGMNCGKCGGYAWWTNVIIRVKQDGGDE